MPSRKKFCRTSGSLRCAGFSRHGGQCSQGCVSNTFTDIMARIYRSHPTVQSCTGEELTYWLADFLSHTAEWDLVTVTKIFFVYIEISKMTVRDVGFVPSVGAFPWSLRATVTYASFPAMASSFQQFHFMHMCGANACACFPDGNLVTGCEDGARIFSSSGDERKRLCEDDDVCCVALLGDERLATSSGHGEHFYLEWPPNWEAVGGPPHLTICGQEGPLLFIGGEFGAIILHQDVSVLELPHDLHVLSVCVPRRTSCHG